MRHILCLLFMLLGVSSAFGQSVDTIVKWHTLKATSNYSKDLANTKDNEYLFVWVGHTDLKLYDQLQYQRNSYIESLPGVKAGMIIGKGKFLQETFTVDELGYAKNVSKILSFIKKKQKAYTVEEQLLGQCIDELDSECEEFERELAKQPIMSVAQPVIIGSPYPTRQLVQPGVALQAGMHKHECGSCGFVWAHFQGSHTCPKCLTGQWLYQYQGPKPALMIH